MKKAIEKSVILVVTGFSTLCFGIESSYAATLAQLSREPGSNLITDTEQNVQWLALTETPSNPEEFRTATAAEVTNLLNDFDGGFAEFSNLFGLFRRGLGRSLSWGLTAESTCINNTICNFVGGFYKVEGIEETKYLPNSQYPGRIFGDIYGTYKIKKQVPEAGNILGILAGTTFISLVNKKRRLKPNT